MASQSFLNFRNNENFEKQIEQMKILNFWEGNDKKCLGCGGILRVLGTETWLTVYRTIAIVYRSVKLEE